MKYLVSIILLFNLSCSHMRSGQYVYFEPGKTLNQLASKYEVSIQNLRKYNRPKKLKNGEWIFVPGKNKTFWDKAVDKHIDLSKEDSKKIEGLTQKKEAELKVEPSKVGSKVVTINPALKFIWPIQGKRVLSSHFGPRRGKFHEGLDIAVPIGREIVASERGEVIYADNKMGGYGNLVVIHHGNEFSTLYAHAKKMYVKKGDVVDKGQIIAIVGMTGKTSGPHLHFEIRKGKRAVNPMNLLKKK